MWWMEYGGDTNDDKSHSSGCVCRGKSVTLTSLGVYSGELGVAPCATSARPTELNRRLWIRRQII